MKRVLIVEDEAIAALLIKLLLERAGFQVVGMAATGEEAIAVAAAESPDLVLMDVHLVGPMDGVEAARAIWTRHRLPIVFVTAYKEAEIRARMGDLEILGFLDKPFDIEALKAVVAKRAG